VNKALDRRAKPQRAFSYFFIDHATRDLIGYF